MSRTYLAEYNNVTVNLTSELLNIKVITSYFIRSDFCICTNVTVTSDHQTLISSSSSQREHFQPALKKFPQLLLRYRVHKKNSYSFIVIFKPFQVFEILFCVNVTKHRKCLCCTVPLILIQTFSQSRITAQGADKMDVEPKCST